MITLQTISTAKGKIILRQLPKAGLSKKQMQSFVIECIGKNLELKHDSRGKPFLTGENAPNVSISYAQNWMAIYLSENGLVGIDIEFITKKVEKIVNLFVNDAEKKSFPALTNETLHLIWCAKEAIFKFYGGDFDDLKNEVEVMDINFQEKRIEAKSSFGNIVCEFEIYENQLVLVYC